ncbi:MAG: pyrroline-5-carboxylate reductase [Alphaproteobacteria bacterium]|nr:pyrroline-5-carboxylate reductase [Alphaproteobacteria bacterium]
MTSAKMLFIGGGKMGSALVRGILGHAKPIAKPSDICVIEPYPPEGGLQLPAGVVCLLSADKIAVDFHPDLILIAVKPQQMAAVLPVYARFTKSLFVSIAAGMTLGNLEGFLGGADYAVVRVMPNLPASIGIGASVGVANKNVSAAQRDLCHRLLESVGTMDWIEDESLMDVVTAISGSGPAYVADLCAVLEELAKENGLPADLAKRLARQTVIGTARFMDESGIDAHELRRAVASPGGTTEAALEVLLDPETGAKPVMSRAIRAAIARGQKLAKPRQG